MKMSREEESQRELTFVFGLLLLSQNNIFNPTIQSQHLDREAS